MKKHELLEAYINELLQPYQRGTIANAQPQNILHQGNFVRTQAAPKLGGYPVKVASDAACAVVLGPKNKILAVSRPGDPSDFAFPGGHVEDNETPLDAAMRELAEETGVTGKNPVQLASLRGSDGRKVHFYSCEGSGEIDTNEDGLVQWVTPKKLLSGQFGKEAQIILHLIGLHI